MKKLLLLFLLCLPVIMYSQEEFYTVADEMPRFPGCEEIAGNAEAKEECAKRKLLEYIYKNVKYPELARKNNIEGVVVVQFIIDKTGSIKDIQLVRDIGGECGTEALKIVESMNQLNQQDTLIIFNEDTYEEEVRITHNDLKWRPGHNNGEPVNVKYTLPIKYKLADSPVETQKDQTIKLHKDNKEDNIVAFDEIFKVVEEMPRFPGCENIEGDNETKRKCANEKMIQYIYQNLKYPPEARKNEVEGMVVIQFIVEESGVLNDIKVVRDIGANCGTEAIKVVESMNNMLSNDTIVSFNDNTFIN